MFQIPGQPVGTRYELRTIFDRIGSLIKWSTQRQKGRTYWLRKRKVRLRHIATMALPHPRARDMAEAMRLNGHALMVTPLVSYLRGISVAGWLTPGGGFKTGLCRNKRPFPQDDRRRKASRRAWIAPLRRENTATIAITIIRHASTRASTSGEASWRPVLVECRPHPASTGGECRYVLDC